MKKEAIKIADYAQTIMDALEPGCLLNTQTDKFNTMVIGWGQLGRLFRRPVFTVYARKSRLTRERLDQAGEFTVSIPLDGADPEVTKICGSLSGRDHDKVKEAGLSLVKPEVIKTPGIKEYPLTLECKTLYQHEFVLEDLPQEVQDQCYPQTPDFPTKGTHTMYIGEIVAAYIIRDD